MFVTVPKNNVDALRKAICSAGGGNIGNYSFCTCSTPCVGTFTPNNNAKPFIGKCNNLEIVEEIKLEVICPVENVNAVLKAIRKTHPYEEPAIDIVPLLNENLFN